MKQRCYNPKHKYYCNYGGRGIEVCDDWLNDYQSFCDWCNNSGYKKGLTLDRINNNGNYEPSNCRWSTRKEQNRNQRTNRKITINGETKLLCEWAEISGISSGNIYKRLKRGWSDNELFKPIIDIVDNTKNSYLKSPRFRFYEENGKKHTIAEWSRITGIKYSTLAGRIRKGLNPFVEHKNNRIEASKKVNSKKILQFSLNMTFIKEYSSISEAAKENNICAPSISACLRGLTRTSNGFIWKYKELMQICGYLDGIEE